MKLTIDITPKCADSCEGCEFQQAYHPCLFTGQRWDGHGEFVCTPMCILFPSGPGTPYTLLSQPDKSKSGLPCKACLEHRQGRPVTVEELEAILKEEADECILQKNTNLDKTNVLLGDLAGAAAQWVAGKPCIRCPCSKINGCSASPESLANDRPDGVPENCPILRGM